MMRIKGKVTSRGITFAIARKELNDVMRAAIHDTAVFHHAEHIPYRFSYYGQKKLNLPPRSPTYTARKRKKFGHVNPNVWSGESRDAALRSPTVRATATRTRVTATIILNAPNLNFRNKKSANRIHPAAEVRAIPDFEAERLTAHYGQRVDFHFGKFRARETMRAINPGAYAT